jgi:hypothetical protein
MQIAANWPYARRIMLAQEVELNLAKGIEEMGRRRVFASLQLLRCDHTTNPLPSSSS